MRLSEQYVTGTQKQIYRIHNETFKMATVRGQQCMELQTGLPMAQNVDPIAPLPLAKTSHGQHQVLKDALAPITNKSYRRQPLRDLEPHEIGKTVAKALNLDLKYLKKLDLYQTSQKHLKPLA